MFNESVCLLWLEATLMREKRVNQSQKTKELKDVENLHRAEEKCRVSSNIAFQKFTKFGIKKRIACLILAPK